jgi:tyrosinase
MTTSGTVFVRRDIWSLQPDDPIVTSYATAVKQMRGRPEAESTSWGYQAAMHGTYATPNRSLWNECQHGTWFFLPWHRMFVYYFERIVRAAVIEAGGPGDWALPYWNYGLEGGDNAKLPQAFREPTLADGSENPLYVAERAEGMNSGRGEIPKQAASPAKALARPAFIGKAEFGGDRTTPAQFSNSGGELEETPHNVVHGIVGGRGPMSDPQRAAQDPIFWLHHANIDRIWTSWSATAEHSAPSEASWRGQTFSFFDEHGHTAALRCDQVLETVSDLGYTYDTTTPPPPAPPTPPAPQPAAIAVRPPEREMIGATEEGVVLTGEPTTVPVPIDDSAARSFDGQVHAYLNIEEIEGESNPGTGYAVYAAAADRVGDAQAGQHLGNLSFFGIERAGAPAGDQAPHSLQTSFDITAVARELETRGQWAGHALRVTFEPLTLQSTEDTAVAAAAHEDRPVRLGRISVFYDA